MDSTQLRLTSLSHFHASIIREEWLTRMISVLVRRGSHSSSLPLPDHADDEYREKSL